jgi:Uma2 family endonuclease
MALPNRAISPDDYLKMERESQIKHEYFAGEVFAMAGASPNHNIITASANRHVGNQLAQRPCIVFSSDQKVKTATGLYTYPDVTVVCGKPIYDDKHADILTNPTLIVEVLSPTTEKYDRGKKFEHYRSLPSFQEYMLIAQDAYWVEVFSRQENGEWLYQSAIGADSMIALRTFGITLSLAELYQKIDFPDET